MGIGKDLRCDNCIWTKSVILGTGKEYCTDREEIIKTSINGKEKHEQILTRFKNGQDPTVAGYALHQCPKCDGLYQRFYLQFDDYKTQYDCSICKEKLKLVNDEKIEEIPCPMCGQKKLSTVGVMLWD